MISLDEEWAIISRLMYGQGFIDELAGFLRQFDIRTILECGCGDGHILSGLSKLGYKGLGIDDSKKMIEMARASSASNITFEHLNWLNLNQITEMFDCVMCRGNGLCAVSSWTGQIIYKDRCLSEIKRSLRLMYDRLNPGGVLYLDTISKREIRENGGAAIIDFPNVHLEGTITYDWRNRARHVYGSGMINGEEWSGGSTSYLMTPEELCSLLWELKPRQILIPQLKHEPNYDIYCAIK